jgi:hypothetical protein
MARRRMQDGPVPKKRGRLKTRYFVVSGAAGLEGVSETGLGAAVSLVAGFGGGVVIAGAAGAGVRSGAAEVAGIVTGSSWCDAYLECLALAVLAVACVLTAGVAAAVVV